MNVNHGKTPYTICSLWAKCSHSPTVVRSYKNPQRGKHTTCPNMCRRPWLPSQHAAVFVTTSPFHLCSRCLGSAGSEPDLISRHQPPIMLMLRRDLLPSCRLLRFLLRDRGVVSSGSRRSVQAFSVQWIRINQRASQCWWTSESFDQLLVVTARIVRPVKIKWNRIKRNGCFEVIVDAAFCLLFGSELTF